LDSHGYNILCTSCKCVDQSRREEEEILAGIGILDR
jgi:hypothetical protein